MASRWLLSPLSIISAAIAGPVSVLGAMLLMGGIKVSPLWFGEDMRDKPKKVKKTSTPAPKKEEPKEEKKEEEKKKKEG